MNTLNISSDIIPIGEFKTRLSQYLKNLHNTGHPLVITQNGKPAGVLISPAEYDDLVYKKLFIESVSRGLSDIESGNVYSTMEIKAELQKRRAARRST
jgi:antitoxin YefM